MRILGVIETAIYVDDLDKTEDFYRGVLGLPVIGKEPGRDVFFQVGAGNVLLAFNPDATLKGDLLPSHGAKGPGHFALGIATEWPQGGKSLYFRDPAGNLVELVTPRIWGLPSGW